MLQVYAKVEWCSKNKVGRCANREFQMSSGGVMGHPQAYDVHHYLDDSLFGDPSFPVKKTSPQNGFPSLFWADDISGHKR
jgi:hypothetical protein